jgi:hypothetical protein
VLLSALNESGLLGFLPNVAAGRTVQTAVLAIAGYPAPERLLKSEEALGFPLHADLPFSLFATVIGCKDPVFQTAIYAYCSMTARVLKENLNHVKTLIVAPSWLREPEWPYDRTELPDYI